MASKLGSSDTTSRTGRARSPSKTSSLASSSVSAGSAGSAGSVGSAGSARSARSARSSNSFVPTHKWYPIGLHQNPDMHPAEYDNLSPRDREKMLEEFDKEMQDYYLNRKNDKDDLGAFFACLIIVLGFLSLFAFLESRGYWPPKFINNN